MKRLITISFLGLLCVTAWADELKPGFRPWTTVVKEADTNKDGMLEPMEIMNFTDISAPGFRPFLAQNFMDFDSDKDGMLAMKEIEKGMKRMGMSEKESGQMFFRRVVYEGL